METRGLLETIWSLGGQKIVKSFALQSFGVDWILFHKIEGKGQGRVWVRLSFDS